MKDSVTIGILLLLALCFVGCEQEDGSPRMLRVSDITPGTTMIGGSTLNTAIIGDTLTISGEGFSGVAPENQVAIEGITALILAASATQLQATVPADVPYSYVKVVVTREGYQPAEHRISVRSTPSPVITGIRPAQGRVGSVVTIYGNHLLEVLEADLLSFADVSGRAAAVQVHPINPLLATADSIRIRIPAGAETGKIALYARPAQNVTNSFGSIVTPVFSIVP